MRKNRFYIPEDLELKQDLTLPKDVRHQVSKVLRLKDGDVIYLFNNSGFEYTAQLDGKCAKIIDKTTDTFESPLKINLAQVIGKGAKVDFVIQKATELGVHSVTPLFSSRSISSTTNKHEHWQKVAIAASCQCFRNFVPKIHEPQTLQKWIESCDDTTKIILSPNAEKFIAADLSSSVSLLVGPEGGFTDKELEIASENGFKKVSLGPRILRTETAGIAAIAIMQSIKGDI